MSPLDLHPPNENDLLSWSTDSHSFSQYFYELRAIQDKLDVSSTRTLIDLYYDIQKLRLEFSHIVHNFASIDVDTQVLSYYLSYLQAFEKSMIRPLNLFARQTVPGEWALAQYGIGPVLGAGLVSYIDITKAKTAGSLWRYAGLDPSVSKNSTKRTWNPDLKNLTWKIGQSFMRLAYDEKCFYGHLYLLDKKRRTDKNNDGHYESKAQKILTESSSFDQATISQLQSGRLPSSHIEAQARRFAVKIFLSHYHAVAYQDFYHIPAPRPHHVDYNGDSIEINIPYFPFEKDIS